MKYVISLLVIAALTLPIACQSCTRWERQINFDIDISGLSIEDKPKSEQLSDVDIRLLKDYAELLRQHDGYSFLKMGGEPELMRRGRRGDLDIEAIKEIVDSYNIIGKLMHPDNATFCKTKDRLAVDLRILYPGVYNYILRKAAV